MTRAYIPKVVTANALLEGDVVYQTEQNGWTRHLSEAELLTDEAHADLRLLEATQRPHETVGVYLADMAEGPAGPSPVHFREEFRRTGPSNLFHGKQADL